ncbi:MAG: hypothetical protein QNK23_18765 [Crocinitomicaceae bacterium]|nr:hypothetical protein [Crocinitomicaceae bacterium]
MAFYIDNSFSMQARGAEGELLSQARENVREIIEKAPLDAQFLIGTNEMSGSEEHLLSKIEALEKLDKISLSPIIRSVDEVLKWQTERLSDDDILLEGTNVQYVYISDFQRSNGFANGVYQAEHISFYPIKLSPENRDNLYIDSIWYSSPVHKLNAQNELNIRIANMGDTDLENVEVVVAIGEFKKNIFVNLPAKQTTNTQLSYMDKTVGLQSGMVRVIDKEVLFDDSFYLSYEVRADVKVLALNGEDAVDNIAAVYGVDDFYLYDEIALTAVTKDHFHSKDLVIINGVNELSQGVIDYLLEFSKTGGSIALFPGKNPTTSNWNNLLGQLKLPLLGQAVGSGNKISSINYDDPFYTGVFETRATNLNLPSVSRVYQALSGSNSLGTDLIQLQNGLPLLSYSKTTSSAYMFYSSLHSDYGSFTQNALFSTVLLRMGELSQRTQPNFVIIGDDTRYPIYSEIGSDQPLHIVNDGIDLIPQISSLSGVNYISLNLIDQSLNLTAGNYDIVLDETIGSISLNYNRRESNLEAMDESEIIASFEDSGISNISFNEIGKGSDVSIIDIDKPFSYWKICIILTLIFVLIEMALVRYLK